jgi:hypothetical protein
LLKFGLNWFKKEMEANNKAKAQIGPYISVLTGFDGKDKIRGIFNDGGGGIGMANEKGCSLDWEGDDGLLLQASTKKWWGREDSFVLFLF